MVCLTFTAHLQNTMKQDVSEDQQPCAFHYGAGFIAYLCVYKGCPVSIPVTEVSLSFRKAMSTLTLCHN